jgi:predicted phage tail protein
MPDSHKSAAVFFIILGLVFLVGANPRITGAAIGTSLNYAAYGTIFSGMLMFLGGLIYIRAEKQRVQSYSP